MAKQPFPKPGLGTIAAAVIGKSGPVVNGLKIPAIVIDPWNNFTRGAFIYAKMIDKLSMSFKSFREPLEESRDLVVIPSIKENFKAQGRPRWPKLKKKTLYNRQMEGYPKGPILDKSGKLKRVATQKNLWDIKDDILLLRTVYFDGKVPYAHYHQTGTRIPTSITKKSLEVPWGFYRFAQGAHGFDTYREIHENILFPGGEAGVMPMRPFIQLTNEEEVEIYNIFVAFMVRQVNKHWGEGDNL